MKEFFTRAGISAAVFIMLISANIYAGTVNRDTLKEGLFLHTYFGSVGPVDPISEKILEGKRIDVSPGSAVRFDNGKNETWTMHTVDSAGWFKGDYIQSGYGLFNIKSDRDKVVLVRPMGNDLFYVNGVPREGNKYAYKDEYPAWEPNFDFPLIPIRLEKGDNQLLFVCNRGMLKVEIEDIPSEILFNVAHPTLPNFLVGNPVNYYAAVTVINATDQPLRNLYLRAYNDSGYDAQTQVPLIQAMSIRKVGFKIVGPAPTSVGTTTIMLSLKDGPATNAKVVTTGEIHIKTVEPTATHDVTFISDIDSSVQYYAIVPPRNQDNNEPKALFFSLHGADVIATNMANSYYPKTWGYIVCPTNGGPYGYDWEDWGRLNALQVLNIARSSLNIDPSRIYLTGHSMGGHGTWIIGAQYPDLFGAIGPSAGWITWWSYVFNGKAPDSPMGKMLRRTTNQVNTYMLDRNFKQLGVYILQGSKDDNVPVTESINMSDTLKQFDKDFIFHEEMGMGHWWGLNDEAGTDCVDWPPMFDFFARHARPGEKRIKIIDFTTCNPGVSAKDYWLTIYSQQEQLEASRAEIKFIPSRNRFVGTTQNVKTMSFDLSIADMKGPFNIDIDSTRIDSITIPSGETHLWLERDSLQWRVTSRPSPEEKGSVRYGTFKDAFRNNMIFVYGTHGTKAENEWAFDRARYDGEYFWYQGGGSVEIVSDKEFNPNEDTNRNVILYGNEETNSAWKEVIDNSPVKVDEGKLTFGEKIMDGRGYTCLMIRPRKGSNIASVGVVSGTGIEGMRLTYFVPYLQPWFSLPDVAILDADIFKNCPANSEQSGFFGQKNGGQIGFGDRAVKIAGFFGLDWSIMNGDFVEQ